MPVFNCVAPCFFWKENCSLLVFLSLRPCSCALLLSVSPLLLLSFWLADYRRFCSSKSVCRFQFAVFLDGIRAATKKKHTHKHTQQQQAETSRRNSTQIHMITTTKHPQEQTDPSLPLRLPVCRWTNPSWAGAQFLSINFTFSAKRTREKCRETKTRQEPTHRRICRLYQKRPLRKSCRYPYIQSHSSSLPLVTAQKMWQAYILVCTVFELDVF